MIKKKGSVSTSKTFSTSEGSAKLPRFKGLGHRETINASKTGKRKVKKTRSKSAIPNRIKKKAESSF